MATLPYYQSQVQAKQFSAQAAPVDSSMPRALNQLAQGANQLAGAVNAKMDRESATFTSDARNKATVDLVKKQELKSSGVTGDQYTASINEFLETEKNKFTDNAPHQRAADTFSAFWGGFSANAQVNAVDTAAKIDAANAASVFETSVDMARTSVYTNPDSFASEVAAVGLQIDSLAISDQKKEILKRDMNQSLNRSRILGDINNNPTKAIIELQSGKAGANANDTESLMRAAVQSKSQKEAAIRAETKRIDAAVNNMEKVVNEATAKDGYELSMNNNLTSEWVNSNRDNLSQSDYKFFIDKLENPKTGTKTDITTYSEAYTMAMDSPEQAEVFAHEALLAGDLSIGDFNKIQSLAQSNGRGELPSSYKQGSSYIKQISGASALNPAVGQRERSANATNDFNAWYAENPNATPTESVDQAKAIWSNYALVNEQSVTMASPYGSGVKSTDVKIEDLKESAKKLQSDFNNGVISQPEYNREVKKLNAWTKNLGAKQ